MIFLHSHGVGAGRVTRIYRTYGPNALALVRANPYRLAVDVWGIGFQTADELAAKLGIDRASPLRALAVILDPLQQLSREGHVGFPEDQLLQRAHEMTSIPEEILRHCRPSRDRPGHRPRFRPRRRLDLSAAALRRRMQCGPQHLFVESGGAPDAQDRFGQRFALGGKAYGHRVGGNATPGDSPSHVQQGHGHHGRTGRRQDDHRARPAGNLRRQRDALRPVRPHWTARRKDSRNRRDAMRGTIHRLLEFEPKGSGFKRNEENPLDVDLLVVDEASMVDISLMDHLLQAIPETACLVLVGDVDQLPSVGPGTVLRDLIGSGVIPVVRLTEIFRQASQSWIVRAAHAVQGGDLPVSAPQGQGDFYFVSAESPEAVIDTILKLIRERIPAKFGFDPVRDVQVLTPMNRSVLGRGTLTPSCKRCSILLSAGPASNASAGFFARATKCCRQ